MSRCAWRGYHQQGQLPDNAQGGPRTAAAGDVVDAGPHSITLHYKFDAGTMEGGRQAEVAKAILSAKNVPYVVAAPLLIQARPQLPEDHATRLLRAGIFLSTAHGLLGAECSRLSPWAVVAVCAVKATAGIPGN
jgi:hypothetical protein